MYGTFTLLRIFSVTHVATFWLDFYNRSVKAILTIEVLVTQEMNEIVNQGIEALRRLLLTYGCIVQHGIAC